ncbi:MAG: PHP domain-containing protein [Nitrospira sp.]|nr:PHP domain-containing protein [Nitrospira sp.]MCP9463125.1 PHP domain-containing protein [Nitrospira sp.]MCP9476178.1 PHP domain-containing protein [Nitrospira sp.]
MPANTAKSPFGYLAEFHCHTCSSHDGLTTEDELLQTCLAKGIGLLTITEHDRLPAVNIRRFQEHGIRIIVGCEFTCERGSHIVGLFLRHGLEKGQPARRIMEHIREQGGLVMIPHPFKPATGFCTLYPDYHEYLGLVSLMEAYNGGIPDQPERVAQIKSLCAQYGIKIVAASDAHKAQHVGYYVTAYQTTVKEDWLETLKGVQGVLLVDSTKVRKPRSLTSIQQNRWYQELVVRVPSTIKRTVKRCVYRWNNRHYRPSIPGYVVLP